jgi:hypothetical protein
MKKQVVFLTGIVFFGLCVIAAQSATVTFSPVMQTPGAEDISSLGGAVTDMDNVGTSTSDGNGNDQTTYIAADRPAQGQTFMTGLVYPEYQVTAITLRHVGYTGNNPGGASGSNTWYSMPAGAQFTIRITDPAKAGTTGFALDTETCTLTGAEADIFASGGVTNTADGTARWVTFTLDSPVVLTSNTLYGFDVASNHSAFFESHGIKDTAAGGNPYSAGSAYTSGASGTPNNSLSIAPGDRVFIVHLTPHLPDNGDLTGNGKVDLEDIALLSDGWQNLYGMNILMRIASNWLSIDLPVFISNPIFEADGQADIAYSSTLVDDVTYYDASKLTYSKTDGAAWLTVAANGDLSGTPVTGDVGPNTFTVQVDDGVNPPIQATLQITVRGNLELLKAVPFTEVTFTDEFWLPRLQTNRQVTVPYIFDQLEGVYDPANNRIDNFAIAGGLMTGTPQYDFPFDDTDIYKTLEGASYSLMVSPDPALDAYLDDLIVKIAAAQTNNGYFPGYLYTIRTNGVDIWCGATPWSNLASSHELYNAGHLIESAIAHYQATGKTSLLNVATHFADLLVDTFHDGGIEIPPGHEIVESALARLSEVTGDPRYLTLAKYYLDIRGTTTDDHSPWGTYHQDHMPVLQQTEAVGHVVRAMYLYMGMADVATRTSDTAYRDALMAAMDSIWHSVFDTKAYITGGLGAEHGGESFGSAYNLPNNGYCETCAQIASVMWNQKMFLYHKDGKYIDVMERTLYNAMISGVSLQGNTFFYPNPLVSAGGYSRSGWFACNCCLGNIARTIPSVPGYVYARGNNVIYVNLYVAGTGTVPLAGNDVQLVQQGGYPWDGNMTITVNPQQSGSFTLYMRIPGWARNLPVPGDLYAYKTQSTESAALDVNGSSVPLNIQNGYVAINRTWQTGDQIHLSLPMPVRQVIAHPSVTADVNRVTLERGPIVYCAEWPDFTAGRVEHLFIPDGTTFSTEYRNDMLGNPAIVNKGTVLSGTVKGLYEGIGEQDVPFVAIPYYAWAHRGQGQMAVWLPAVSSLAVAVPAPTPSELIGHWTLDETSGTSAADTSGKGMVGTLTNGLNFSSNSVAGQVGRALSFDGTDDYVDIPNGYSDFVKGCTISVWVYPTAVKNWERFIDFGNGSASDNIWFGRQGTTNNLAFEGWSSGSSNGLVTASEAISLLAWQMFTVTVDSSGNVKLYKDGQQVATGTSGVSSVTRTNNYIGRSNWSWDDYYQGNMDDVRIYNYCLTDAQVLTLYSGQ